MAIAGILLVAVSELAGLERMWVYGLFLLFGGLVLAVVTGEER